MLTAGFLAGCSVEREGSTVTVTVPPSTAPTPTGSTPATSSTAAAVSSPTATTIPGTCASLLSEYYVEQALGNARLGGTTAFVVGVPDATIGRLATINCRYGVTGTGAAARSKVEIGVSLYRTAAQAQARVTATTTDYTGRGATATPATVPAAGTAPAVDATYLSGASGTGYTQPLLVLADDRRTVAVSIDPAAIGSPPAAQTAQQAALAVARVALTRTAG